MVDKPLWAKMLYTRALGTPYVRGKPVEVGKNLSRYKADAPVMISDTVYGQEIYWFEVGDLLIAVEPVLYSVSYGALETLGLVHGRQITIDGKAYNCRLIQAIQEGEPRMSDEMDDLEKVAHGWSVFSRKRFLSQEGDFNRILGTAAPANLSMGYAWYPVLEPLAQKPEALVGKKVLLDTGSRGIVSGMLKDASDYELLIGSVSFALLDPNCMCRVSGGDIVVSSDDISKLQETDNMEYHVRQLTAEDERSIQSLSTRIQNEYLGEILSMEGFPYGLFARNKLVGYCMLCPVHGTLGMPKKEVLRVRPEDGLLIDDVFILQEHRAKGRTEFLVKTSMAKALTAPTPYGVGFLEKDATRPSLILPVRGWWCHRGGSCSPLAGRRTLRRMHACCATSRRKLYAPKHPLFSCGRWLPIFMRLMHSP